MKYGALATLEHVVVTGGSGFVGHNLIFALCQLGKKVRVLDIASLPPSVKCFNCVEGYNLDVVKPERLPKALAGADVVFHVAGNSSGSLSVVDPEFDYEVNVKGTENVARAAADAGVKRFVYVSSASVYGRPKKFPINEDHQTEPFIPYGISKLAGEHACLDLCRTAGLPVVIARPFCVYGQGENIKVSLCEVGRYLRWHWNKQPIQIVGDRLRKTRDFVSVRDCVSGLIHIANKGTVGEIYNVGSGRETSMLELVQLIEKVTERAATIIDITHITDDTYRLVADISKLESLGYRPQVALADGIRQMLSDSTGMQQIPTNMTIFSPNQVAETFVSSGCEGHAPAGIA